VKRRRGSFVTIVEMLAAILSFCGAVGAAGVKPSAPQASAVVGAL
jgi:hypothetical protein